MELLSGYRHIAPLERETRKLHRLLYRWGYGRARCPTYQGGLNLGLDAHCAPLERVDWNYRRAIDLSLRWSEKRENCIDCCIAGAMVGQDARPTKVDWIMEFQDLRIQRDTDKCRCTQILEVFLFSLMLRNRITQIRGRRKKPNFQEKIRFPFRLLQSDPGINEGIADVCQQQTHDIQHRTEINHATDNGEILCVDSVNRKTA